MKRWITIGLIAGLIVGSIGLVEARDLGAHGAFRNFLKRIGIDVGGSSSTELVIRDGTVGLSAASGILTIAGKNGTNNENVILDLETTANEAKLTTTSTNTLKIDMGTGVSFTAGNLLGFAGKGNNSANFRFATGGTTDYLALGLNVDDVEESGYFIITEGPDVDHANRRPAAVSLNPVLRGYSSDETAATDYWELTHDQSTAILGVGAGDLVIRSSSNAFGLVLKAGNTNSMFSIRGDLGFDQVRMDLVDGTGNQLIITSANVASNRDFDHTTTTDPTKFMHSDTDPTQSTTEYGSESHDKSDYVFNSGFGSIKLGADAQPARGTLTLSGGVPANNETFVINATTITAKTSGAGTDEFDIGDAPTTITNIVAAINAGSESANAHAWDGAADTVVIEWLTKGTAGNSITFTEAMSNTTIDGSNVLGGTHAGIAAVVVADVNPALGGGIVFSKVTADPCASLGEGALFYNDTNNELCFCDGTNDLRIKDATTACF